MSLSKRTRFEIFKRDSFTCQYCGKRPPDVMLEVDHVMPVCEGGSDDPSNLTTACLPCNRGKAGIPLGAVAPALDELEVLSGIQEMLERANALRRSAVVADAQRQAESEAIAHVLRWWREAGFITSGAPQVEQSLRLFVKRLDLMQIRDAIDSTERRYDHLAETRQFMSDDATWKYFCGACWNMIRDQERA